MKKLLLSLCLLVHIGVVQANQIDSLKRELNRLDNQPNGYTNDTLRFQALKSIMRAYVDVNIDSSVYFNSLMIRLCSNPKLQKELIYAYQYAGYLNFTRGDYHESVLFYFKALPIAEKLKQFSRTAISYGGLAHAYNSLKEFPKAAKLCQQGLAILQKHPDPTTQLFLLNVLEGIYQDQGKYTEALKVSQEMYKLAKSQDNLWHELQSLHLIGWVYMELGDLTNALAYYEKALTIAQDPDNRTVVGSLDLKASILLHIGSVYTQQQKWRQALAYCKRAKQMAMPVKNSNIVMEADEKLHTIYKQTGRLAEALSTYENYVLLKDSLAKQTNRQRIESLQAQYDNVQKTNALQGERMNRLAEQNRNQQLAQTRNGLFWGIAVIFLVAALLFWNNRRLQAKNQKIDQQRALLETARGQLFDINKTLEARVDERTEELVNANRELIQTNEKIKAALFKGQTIERKRVALELHDNLSSLLSAVNMSMQSINPQNLSESEQSVYRNVKYLIQNAYAEVRNISHNILPAELEREGLAPTLTTLIDRLSQQSTLQFSLTLTGLKERLPVEIEFNVYSIILELINNAMKHAQATTVGIILFRTELRIDLSVTDDGIGLGQSQTKRGVGLQNIQARLDSLGGMFMIRPPAEKGTRIDINIPIDMSHINGNSPVI